MRKILDACCGSRMFWFDKNNPDVVYADNRKESHVLCDGRFLEINPDIIMDFTKMPFDDNTFSLVVFDPPQLVKLGKTSWMAKKYGVLIFKWNETQIPVKKILSIIDIQPLFGHPTGRYNKTIWMAFMKQLPKP